MNWFNPTIIAAYISGIFGIVLAIVTSLLRMYENRFTETISRFRRRHLAGTWNGKANQIEGPGPGKISITFDITLHLVPKRKIIGGWGRATIKDWKGKDGTQQPGEFSSTFDIKGSFLQNSYLLLEYHHYRREAIQFGSIILKMDATGKELEGLYNGYGILAERLVRGTATLNKE